MATGGPTARRVATLACVLALAWHSASGSDSDKCSSKRQCCQCVATPGCSWFYKTSLGDFCKETPKVGKPSGKLPRRTPFRLDHEVEVIKNETLDITPVKKNKRVYMAPQELHIRQGVGMRQEVTISTMSNTSKLAFRVIDFTDHAVQYTVVAASPDSCEGSDQMKKRHVNFQLKWDGYRRARNRIPIELNGRQTRIKGDKSFLRVICWRDIEKRETRTTHFKLIIDTPTCFMGTRQMLLEMPWQKTRKRVVIKVSNDDCKCPCTEDKSAALVELENHVVKGCGVHANSTAKQRRRAKNECFKQAADVAKSMNCEQENNDKCQAAPYQDICSGKGTCLCGRCVCEPGQSGEHCECNDASCPVYQGKICGGRLRGVCSCGKCRCKGNRSGTACEVDHIPQSCRFENGLVCSGHGSCVEGRCQCWHHFTGEFCEVKDECQQFRHCAECHLSGHDNLSMDRFCLSCKKNKDKIFYRSTKGADQSHSNVCHFTDEENCQATYYYRHYRDDQNNFLNTTVFVDKNSDCTLA